MKANVVYWYGLNGMPRDGGGLRALAWHAALTHLGFETSVVPLRPGSPGTANGSWLRTAKKLLVPMPLATKLPTMGDADLNVVTVPAVFDSAAKILPRHSLVFDWMDMWSVNARTMGNSSVLSRPGGLIQSAIWARRQQRLVSRPAANVFAGYEDLLSTALRGSAPGYWVPTPITADRGGGAGSESKNLTVGFIGNFEYPPNVMSLRNFFKRYDKAFVERGIKVVVAGYGSEVVNDWDVHATVLGRVESLSGFYGGIDAALVPIDHGGGIKAKAVEAMAYGVPLVGTRHVKSGFGPEWGRFVGSIDDLLLASPKLPSVPKSEDFGSQFSQEAFEDSVKFILAKMEKRSFRLGYHKD